MRVVQEPHLRNKRELALIRSDCFVVKSLHALQQIFVVPTNDKPACTGVDDLYDDAPKYFRISAHQHDQQRSSEATLRREAKRGKTFVADCRGLIEDKRVRNNDPACDERVVQS